MQIYYTNIKTLVGSFLVAGTESTLRYTSFSTGKEPRVADDNWINDSSPLQYATIQFEAYFSGELQVFDICHEPVGTPFQMSVWQALATIPYGRTVSYGNIATQIGNPGASQAVGAANGANPIPILIPCHRVIGGDGSLTGFGGGLETKQKLLRHEGIATAEDQLDLFEPENQIDTCNLE